MLVLILAVLIENYKLIEGKGKYYLAKLEGAELDDTEYDQRKKELKDEISPYNVNQEADSDNYLKNIGISDGSTIPNREFNFQIWFKYQFTLANKETSLQLLLADLMFHFHSAPTLEMPAPGCVIQTFIAGKSDAKSSLLLTLMLVHMWRQDK